MAEVLQLAQLVGWTVWPRWKEIGAGRVEAFLDPRGLARARLLGELGGDQGARPRLEDRQLVFDIDGHLGRATPGRERVAEV